MMTDFREQLICIKICLELAKFEPENVAADQNGTMGEISLLHLQYCGTNVWDVPKNFVRRT